MTLSELLDFQSNRSRLEEIRRNRRNIVPFVGAGISIHMEGTSSCVSC